MRLIDADELNKSIAKETAFSVANGVSQLYREGLLATKIMMDVCKTVDAVPVRRGRWIPHITEDGYKSGYDCSVCGVWLIMPNGLRKYCCDCGALMDGGEKDG